MRTPHVRSRRVRGFTLVELLVALFAMALLAMLSWRSLDAMTRAQSQTQARADDVLALQVGLSQWTADLNALVQLPQAAALDWNGRVLRLTRTMSAADGDSMVVVVGWTRRSVDGRSTWLRWQSPPLTTRGEVDDAWRRADVWSQTPSADARALEVAVTPLDEWQIFFFRGDAWTNPLSSDVAGASSLPPGTVAPAAAGAVVTVLPEGVRLVLTLPPTQPVRGLVTLDWVRPTIGGGKS